MRIQRRGLNATGKATKAEISKAVTNQQAKTAKRVQNVRNKGCCGIYLCCILIAHIFCMALFVYDIYVHVTPLLLSFLCMRRR